MQSIGIIARAVIELEVGDGNLQRFTIPNIATLDINGDYNFSIKGRADAELIPAGDRTDDLAGWHGADNLFIREGAKGRAPNCTRAERTAIVRLMGIYASQRIELFRQRQKYDAYVAEFNKNIPTVLTFKQWSEKAGQR